MCEYNKYEKIITQILNGDTDLYKEIVVEYKNNIFAVIYSMIRNYHTAEDLTQDVFIDAYIKLNSLSDYDKLGAWLMKITKNKCYNYLGRQALKYKQEYELEDYLPDFSSQTPENYLIAQYERDNLEKAVKNLPDLYKNVTILFYFENYSQKKIAEVLNIQESTVKNRLYDARLKLKKELDTMNTTVKLSDDAQFEEKVMTIINNILPKMRDENFLKLIDEEIEKFGKNKNALGMLYYWRGASQIQINSDKKEWLNENFLNGANKDFEKAAEYINDDNKYKGAAVSGVKLTQVLSADRDKYIDIMLSTAGETLKAYDNKIDWLYNPGFNIGWELECPQTAYFQIYLWAARINKHLLDLNIAIGGTKTDENGNTMTLISKDEKIKVLSGTFENCLHINIKFNHPNPHVVNRNYNADIWYAKDVGLIKFYDSIKSINYELRHYKINGGSGYIPVSIGNLWSYKNTNLADGEYYQFNEYEIVSITEKSDGKYINLASTQCFKHKKI